MFAKSTAAPELVDNQMERTPGTAVGDGDARLKVDLHASIEDEVRDPGVFPDAKRLVVATYRSEQCSVY